MKRILQFRFHIFLLVVSLISISALKIFDGPILTPAKPVFNFDTVMQGTIVKRKIPFQNTGKSNLFIMYATSNDAAIVPHWNTIPVMPGKWDTIYFDFSIGKKLGRQKNEITVVDNCENQQSILKITGVVIADTTRGKTTH